MAYIVDGWVRTVQGFAEHRVPIALSLLTSAEHGLAGENPHGWWRCDYGLTDDGGGLCSGVLDYPYWSRNLTNHPLHNGSSGTTHRPLITTATGGIPALTFDGIDDYIVMGNLGGTSNSRTVIVTYEPDLIVGTTEVVVASLNTSIATLTTTSGKTGWYNAVDGWYDAADAVSGLQALIYVCDSVADLQRMYRNGAQIGSDQAYTEHVLGSTFSMNSASQPFAGKIVELIEIEGVISNVALAWTWVNLRWGVDVTP